VFIGIANSTQGNKAIASVLLLYYHLLREGGITHDQTIYIDPEEFNAFEYVKVEVDRNQKSEINQDLLRRGAVIALLCELNDMITEYEGDYLSQPFTIRIFEALGKEACEAVPEVSNIIATVRNGEASLDYEALQSMFKAVFERYVVQEIRALVSSADV
jgi:hypothetical protein